MSVFDVYLVMDVCIYKYIYIHTLFLKISLYVYGFSVCLSIYLPTYLSIYLSIYTARESFAEAVNSHNIPQSFFFQKRNVPAKKSI